MNGTFPLIMVTQLPDITIPEAARKLRVSWKTANRWVRSGRLPAVKLGGRYRTTEEWIQTLIVAPVSAESHEDKKKHGHSNNEETARQKLVTRWGLKKVPCP